MKVMSITGSLFTYENNIGILKISKKRKPLFHSSNLSSNNTSSINMSKTLPSSLNSSNLSTVLNDPSIQNKHQLHTNFQPPHLQAKCMNSKRKHTKYNNMYSQIYPDHNNYLHLNSLWSIWYGVLLTLFQGYLAVHGAYRFLGCSLIQWKIEPVAELNLQIILSGLVFVLLPFFFTSAVFKVGNFANDGIKLGSLAKERRCSMTQHDSLEEESRNGTLQTLWIHGGPTAAFIHILIAMCLLLPRLLLEARIIENGLLPRETIWKTELDFVSVNRRNLVILSVISSPYQNNSSFELREDEDYFNDTLFTAYSSSGKNVNNHLNENFKQKEQTLIQKTRKPKNMPQEEKLSTDITSEFSKKSNYSNSNELNNETNEYLIEKDLRQTTLIPMKSEIQTAAPLSGVKSSVYEEITLATVSTSQTIEERLFTNLNAEYNTSPNITRTNALTTSNTNIDTTPTFKQVTVISPNIDNINFSTLLTPNYEPRQVSHTNRHNSKSARKLLRKGKLHSNLAKHKNYHQYHSEKTSSNRLENLKITKNDRSDVSKERTVDLFSNNNIKTLDTNLGGKIYEHTPTLFEEINNDRTRINILPKLPTTLSTTRDSNIHIVKPEKLPEIIPSTPLSSDSKIIEIKSNIYMKSKRSISVAEENRIEFEPEYLIDNLSLNDSSDYIGEIHNPKSDVQTVESENNVARLDGFAGMLQILFGIEKPIDVNSFSHPPSAEFLNLLFALLVWSVRYPAVFWATTKSFATIFSVQMIAAAADIVFSYAGISSLFKLQIYGQFQHIQILGLILNARVTLALFLLSVLLILSSSMVMYLYGHGRLSAKVRDRSIISFKSNESWVYFSHCASLCYILSLAVVKAPLLNDLSATYRYNLHCPTFLAALVSVMHIFMWIIIWIGLTVKRKWNFKLPPLDAYSLIAKSTTQPLLLHNRGSLTNTSSVSYNNSAVIGLNNTTEGEHMELKINCNNAGKPNKETASANILNEETSNDIYWPKITPSSPKLKVTFNEVTSTSDDDHHMLMGDNEQNDGKRSSPRGTSLCITSIKGKIDDGEYATLKSTAEAIVGIDLGNGHSKEANNKLSSANILQLSEYDELPPPPPSHMVSSMTITSHTTTVTINPVGDYLNSNAGSVGRLLEDNISEEGKLLACVRDDSVTYASTHDIEPPFPPPPFQPTEFNSTKKYTSNVVDQASQAISETIISPLFEEQFVSPTLRAVVTTYDTNILSGSTQRSIRRADSGVPHEALTPRSDSTSSGNEGTTSPPGKAPSESSSGVHSAEEKDTDIVIRSRVMSKQLPKLPPPVIQEEPHGRCTNMRMSSFVGNNQNSATLPLLRSNNEQKVDYSHHCSTMPMHYQQQTQSAVYANSAQCMSQSHNTTTNLSSFKTPLYANTGVGMSSYNNKFQQTEQQQQRRSPPPPPSQITHNVSATGVRYSNPNFLRLSPYIKSVESANSYQTFSKNTQENTLPNTTISEDRDSANYSMSSDQDCLYATANGLH